MRRRGGKVSHSKTSFSPRPKIYDRWGRDISEKREKDGFVVICSISAEGPSIIQAAGFSLEEARREAEIFDEINLHHTHDEVRLLTTTEDIVAALRQGKPFAAHATNKLVREAKFRKSTTVDFEVMNGLMYFPSELNLQNQKERVAFVPQP